MPRVKLSAIDMASKAEIERRVGREQICNSHREGALRTPRLRFACQQAELTSGHFRSGERVMTAAAAHPCSKDGTERVRVVADDHG